MSKRARHQKNVPPVSERVPVESPVSAPVEPETPETVKPHETADEASNAAEVIHLAESTHLAPETSGMTEVPEPETSESVPESIEPIEPLAEATPDAVIETASEPVAEPVTKTIHEPIAEPVTESAVEPAEITSEQESEPGLEAVTPIEAEAQHIPSGEDESVLDQPETKHDSAPMPPAPTEHSDEVHLGPDAEPEALAAASVAPETIPETMMPETPAAPAKATPANAVAAGVPARSFAAKTYDALAVIGPLAALLFLLLHLLPGFDLRHLWIPGIDEAVSSGYNAFKRAADPVVFGTLDVIYPSFPPVYFWFLAGLESLWLLTPVPVDMTVLLIGGTLVSCALLVVLTWIMARVCCGNRQEAFAACAVLLTTLIFCFVGRFATPQPLFVACILLSCLFLYSGYVRPSAPLSLLLGFLLAGVAVFINGLLGLIVPLGASFLFLMWRGTFRRAGAKDGAFAFFALLALFGGFLAWLGLTYGSAPLDALLRLSLNPWELGTIPSGDRVLAWGLYAVVLLLPWPLLLFFLPWERFYRLPVLLWHNRNDAPGVGFVWCAVLVCLACLPFHDNPIMMIMLLLPFAAILIGRAVIRLSPRRSCLFFGLLGILLFLFAVVMGLGTLLPVIGAWLPTDIPGMAGEMLKITVKIAALPGMAFAGAGALIFAFILLKCTDKRYPAGGLLVSLLCVTILTLPVNLLTVPGIQSVTAKNAVSAPTEAPAEAVPPATPPAVLPVVPETPVVPPIVPETPAETPEPTPAEVPAEAPVESPAETPTPTETPAEPTAETPAPAEIPAEAPEPTPVAAPAETPAENPAN